MAKKQRKSRVILILIAIVLVVVVSIALFWPQALLAITGHKKVENYKDYSDDYNGVQCLAQIPSCGYCSGKVINDECWERKK